MRFREYALKILMGSQMYISQCVGVSARAFIEYENLALQYWNLCNSHVRCVFDMYYLQSQRSI